MKARNTANQWQETATLPKSNDWSWKAKKTKRARRKSSLAKTTKKVAKKRKTVVAAPAKIVSTITLESLGLSFNPTTLIKSTIV
jgi:hypothetical protein